MATPPLSIVSSEPLSQGQGLSVVSSQPLVSTPAGFWQSVKDRLQFAGAGPIGKGDLQPDAKPQGVTDNAWQQQKQVLKDTFNQMVDTASHPSQILQMLPGWDQVKSALTPKEVDQVKSGDYKGAAGTGVVDAVNLFAGALNPESNAERAANAGAASVRGAAKTTNAVLHSAPDVIPSALVPPIVKKLAQKVTVPGEDFGFNYYDKSILPDQAGPVRGTPLTPSPVPVQPQREIYPARGPLQGPQLESPSLPPQRATSLVNPVPNPVTAEASAAPTAAERQAYLDQIATKRQAMGLTKPEVAPESPAAPAVPSEDEVAKGIGYSGGAKQAQQRLGPQAWQQTYQKIAGPPSTVEDVIDKAVPPEANRGLNMQTKAKVDFYVQKGNVDAAKEAIQSAATQAKPSINRFADAQDDAAIQQQMRQNLQQQYATGRLVEGREQAAGMSADRTKLAGIPKQGEQFATRLSRYPAPEADLETNKMLGYDQHATPQPVATPTARPNEQPWGGLSDDGLTAILQKSVELAKKSKRVQTK